MADLPEQIITRPDELAGFCAALARQPAFGFDTEFVGEDTYHPRLCLVQVATADGLSLLDPLTADLDLSPFWKLVAEPGRTAVVHAGREEVRLCRLWAGAVPGGLFDLQIAAGLVGRPYPLGHGNLVQQVLGRRLPKGETLTEWRRRPLTPAQVRYAFDDVRYLLPLWQRLSARLDELGRSAWAQEEFARLAAAAVPDAPALDEKWRRLRGLSSLDRRRLAVVRALFLWREEEAARSNRPTRQIVRDDLIIEIARRGPVREKDLHVVRGLPRRDLPAVVQTVEQARALPPEQWPEAVDREQDVPQVALVTSILTAVLADLCARRELAANLVASTADVRQVVRARHAGEPLPEASLLTRGWRSQHILPDLLDVLEGRRAVRIADLAAEAPLGYDDAERGSANRG
jgi:ribonuclease D